MIMMPLYTVPEAVLGGSNQLHKCMGVNPLAAIAGGALMVTAAYIGWGLVGLASALVAATIIRGVFVLRVTNNSVTWFGIERPSRSEVRHFFGFSGLVLCWTLIERVMLTGDVVLMGFVISAEKAASYSLSQYAMQTSIAVTALTVFAVVPGLGDIVGRRDFQKAGKIRSEIMSGTWLVSTIFGSAILLLNRSFVELWVGNDIFIGRIENFLMVILMMQLIFIRTDACVIDVTLNIKKKVMLGGMSTVLSIGLAYVFAQTWESRVSGLIVGLILGQALLTLSYPVLVNSAFGLSMRKGICCIIRPLLATVFMFSAAMYAQECLEIESWPTLILFGFGAVAVIVLTAFFAGLSAEQRAQLMKRIRHIRARKADNQ
jgi:O-antigen/teichoic acid export membrane protein